QSEALPPPGPSPYSRGPYQEGALPPGGRGTYQDGGLPPPSRGYSYGNWEPIRPPGDVYAPGDRSLSPGPGRPSDYADRPPMEITPYPGSPSPPGSSYSPPGSNYAALPPDYRPETGLPKELPPQFRRQMVDYPAREPAGTIVIDTPNTYLYLVLGGG